MRISITPVSESDIAERRLCWYEPQDATQDQEVTLYFNAAAGNAALKGYTGTVYISSGIVTSDNDDLSGLMHIIGKDETAIPEVYTMVRSEQSPDIYTLRMTPERYYAIDADTRIKMLGLTFTSSDESLKACDTDGGIIYVPFRANTGTMWYRPENAAFDEQVTLHFDAAAGNAGLKGYEGNVFVHCGLITGESSGTSDWKYQSGWLDNDSRYRMRRSTVNPDQYTMTFTPAALFGTDEGTDVRDMVFVARNSDASRMGKEADGGDILVPFVNSADDSSRTPLGHVTGWSRDEYSLTVTTLNGRLQLTPYNDYIVKVFTSVDADDTPERRSMAVSASPEAQFDVSETDTEIILTCAAVIARISKSDAHVTFLNKSGRIMLAEDAGLDNSARPRMATFRGMGDEAFYGGGYNGQRINHNGRNLVMNNTQTGGWENSWQAPHNICIPFVVSTSGYGLLFDDTYRNARITPSDAGTSYSSYSPTPVSYFYIGSDDGSQASVMENYTWLTGRQELPPYWALGYMTSRYGYKSQAEADEVIRSIKAAGLPLDGIVFDLYWQGEGNSGMGNLDWYKPNFPDPQAMMAGYDAQGVKTICITEPFFTSATSNYIPFRDAGYFADDDVSGMEWLGASPVGLIDASNAAAMDAMWQFYKARTAEGMGGWWLDLGEPERHDADSHHMGGSVSQIHNEFGNLWTERVYRGLKEDFPQMRPFLMPRAACAGIQRYAAFPWTGDIKRSWGGLQAQVPALISAGMSGIGYMGNDVGGFSASSTDPELYLRWIEMAVFSPMMRTHSTHLPEPYQSCYAEVLPAVRDFLNMRYSYLPYTYTLAWQNATSGAPLARPVNYHDTSSAQPSSADCGDQYLWGRDILVAPVMTSGTSRRITFPQGSWVDLDNLSAVYAGGSTIDYEAPLDKLPHFGRMGSFITRFSQSTYTNTRDIDNTRLSVTYLADLRSDDIAQGILFDDDRTSTTSLADGEYTTISFTGENTDSGHRITISQAGSYPGMPSAREITFMIPAYTAPVDAVYDNTNDGFTKYLSKDELDKAAGKGWYMSPSRELYVKTTHHAGARTDINISSETSGASINGETPGMVVEYISSSRSISYSIPSDMEAHLDIYSMEGICKDFVSGLQGSGIYPLRHLCPGVYAGKMEASSHDGRTVTKSVKLLLQ